MKRITLTILIILCVFSMSSCTIHVNKPLIDTAEKVCDNNGGLDHISAELNGINYRRVYAVCTNGAKFDLEN